jgi:hypothetical protein
MLNSTETLDVIITQSKSLTSQLEEFRRATIQRGRTRRNEPNPHFRNRKDAPLPSTSGIVGKTLSEVLSYAVRELKTLADNALLTVADYEAAHHEPMHHELTHREPTHLEPTQVEPTQVEPTQVEPTQVEPTQVEPTQVEPTQVEPTQVEPTQVEPTQVEPTQVEPTQVEPTQVEPTQVEPTQVEPTQVEPTQVEPTQVEPTQVEPTQVEPTQVEPTQVEPTQVEPTQVEPTQVEPTQVEPTQVEPTLSCHLQGVSIDGNGTHESHGRQSPARFPCTLDDMGSNMVSTVLKAREALGAQAVDERGYLLLDIEMSWDDAELYQLVRTSTLPTNVSGIVKGFQLNRGGTGFVHATVDEDATLDLSAFEDLRNADAPIKCTVAFQDLADVQSNHVSYLISEPLSHHWVNSLLDAGPKCNQRPAMLGVNSLYWYVSCDKNTPAPLHREDGNTGSANLLLAGAEKQWIFIHKGSSDRLEKCIRSEFPGSRDCTQFIRHHNLVLETSWLDERTIGYDIVRQQPGEVVITFEGPLYHQVLNSGFNFAIAINWERPNAPDYPVDYNWCQEGKRKCGKGVLQRKDFLPPAAEDSDIIEYEVARTLPRKRQRLYAPSRAPMKRRKPCSIEPVLISLSIQERLLKLILSMNALQHCVSLIKAWRSQNVVNNVTSLQGDQIGTIAASDKRVQVALSRTDLGIVQLRLAQYDLAVSLRNIRDGAMRLSTEQYNSILKEQGYNKPSKQDREQLKTRVKHATTWFLICGDFGPGLLCLLPKHIIPESSYTSMKRAEIQEFNALASEQKLEIRRRCAIGVSIHNMFSVDVEFHFEYQGLVPDDTVCEEDMINYLQPVLYPKANVYTPSDVWSKPALWDWNWPQDPTWAPAEPCSECALTDCICFANLPRDRHRIVNYESKGRGIQARGASWGQLAFCKGEYIEEFIGEIKPVNFETDDYMAIDVDRLDVGLTCRLYCGEKSNWTRLVNHSCNPCAEIVVEIRPGRARVMLRALQDIRHGTEITISYGGTFAKDEICLCEVCSKRVATREIVVTV